MPKLKSRRPRRSAEELEKARHANLVRHVALEIRKLNGIARLLGLFIGGHLIDRQGRWLADTEPVRAALKKLVVDGGGKKLKGLISLGEEELGHADA